MHYLNFCSEIYIVPLPLSVNKFTAMIFNFLCFANSTVRWSCGSRAVWETTLLTGALLFGFLCFWLFLGGDCEYHPDVQNGFMCAHMHKHTLSSQDAYSFKTIAVVNHSYKRLGEYAGLVQNRAISWDLHTLLGCNSLCFFVCSCACVCV